MFSFFQQPHFWIDTRLYNYLDETLLMDYRASNYLVNLSEKRKREEKAKEDFQRYFLPKENLHRFSKTESFVRMTNMAKETTKAVQCADQHQTIMLPDDFTSGLTHDSTTISTKLF